MGREEVLLKEYETCQQYINALDSQVWVSTTVFMSVNVALLGGITSAIITRHSSSDVKWLPLLLAISIVAILILWLWTLWLRRAQFNHSIAYERMREIEDELRMEKNWLIYGLDLMYGRREEWERLSLKRRARFLKLGSHYPRYPTWQFWKGFPRYTPPRGFDSLILIAYILIAGWIIFAIFIGLSPILFDC